MFIDFNFVFKIKIPETDEDNQQLHVGGRHYGTTKEGTPSGQYLRRLQVRRFLLARKDFFSTFILFVHLVSLAMQFLLLLNFIIFRWELGFEETSMPNTLTTDFSDCSPTTHMGPELLVVLQSCKSLRRFAIVTDQFIIVDLKNGRFNWKSLVFACIISPKINWNAREFHVTSSHPAFHYYLGTSMAEAGAQLPPLHFNEMVLFESQILKLP